MYKILIIIWLFLMPFNCLFGQAGQMWMMNVLVCDSLQNPIPDVGIYDTKDNIRGVTNRNGLAQVYTKQGERLYFSHLAYNKQPFRVDKRKMVDIEDMKNFIVVTLKAKTIYLPDVEIVVNAPHLAYENKMVWVVDYQVREDGIYMLTCNGMRSGLLHLDLNQDTISYKSVPVKFQELFQDAFGNIHLLSQDSVYQVYCDGNELQLLYGNSKETFEQKLKPVVAATDSIMVMEARRYYGQEIIFQAVKREGGQKFVLADISGKTLEMAKNWDMDNYRASLMYDPNNQQGYNIYRVDASGQTVSKFDDIQKRLMLQDAYSPLISVGDEIYLFNFLNDVLCVFDQNGQFQCKYDIDFHKQGGGDKKITFGNSWDENLIVDPKEKKVYAQYISGGIVTLKEIDLNSGRVKRETRLTDHSFPQNIQVFDGEVYYLYLDERKVVDRDRRSLYKMMLK